MGRAGYMGCLVMLGVVLMSVGTLAFFGWTGAINANTGPGAAVAARPLRLEPTSAPREAPVVKEEPPPKEAPVPTRPSDPQSAEKPADKPPEKSSDAGSRPVPAGTVAPKPVAVGPESNIAQRLDREATGGGIKLKALGAAKTTQGERAVLAIYVRIENGGTAPVRVDPAFFKIADRAGARHPISKAVEASLPAIELAPRASPSESGKLTEGNLTFELPRAAAGLALTYEAPNTPALRIPLPPEFG